MTKELEMTNIEFLKEHIEQLKEVLFDDNVPKHIIESVGNELKYWKNILKALTELQAIKEAKPSEALEEVKQIKFYVGTIIGLEFVKGNDVFSEAKKQDYEIFKIKCGKIEQALLKAEKLEKAWEVVKEKNVDIEKLKYQLRIKDDDVYLHYKYDLRMTREEFDLLKEMIDNG